MKSERKDLPSMALFVWAFILIAGLQMQSIAALQRLETTMDAQFQEILEKEKDLPINNGGVEDVEEDDGDAQLSKDDNVTYSELQEMKETLGESLSKDVVPLVPGVYVIDVGDLCAIASHPDFLAGLYYPNNWEQRWCFLRGAGVTSITMSCGFFRVHKNCWADRLIVYPIDTDQLKFRLCGEQDDYSTTIINGDLWLVFKTNWRIQRRGFFCTITAA